MRRLFWTPFDCFLCLGTDCSPDWSMGPRVCERNAWSLKAGLGALLAGGAVAGGGGDSAAAIGVADALAVGLPLLVPQIEPGDRLPVGGVLL